MNKNFNGKTLSKKYWGIGLDSADKILLDEIISLGNQRDGCYASDEHFAELLEETRVNINRRIQKLKKQGRIFVTRVRNGKKWKRTIKFISLVESKKLIHPNPAVESNNLMDVESNNLMEGKQQIVTGILQYKETEIENDAPEPTGEEVIFNIEPENTGPENKAVDNSDIHFPSSIDYGKMNLREENGIPTREQITMDLKEEPKQTIPTREQIMLDVKEEPIQTIPTRDSKILGPKNTIPTDAPEFLKKGVWVNEEPHFPLDFTFKSGQMSIAEFKQNQMTGLEIIKILNKEMKSMEIQYKKNKDLVINKDYMAKYREELMRLDFQNFIDYLNSISLHPTQKKLLRPSANIMKQFSSDIKFFRQAILNTKLKFALN
jgi:biotin operon repressor